MPAICVFCGSKPGARPVYAQAARDLGTELAARGLDLVYGGARHGLMGEVASAVLAGGGRAFGVVPRNLMRVEFPHPGLTQLHLVDSMAERKALMGRLADAFVALPGGFGTLDELFEVLTERQLSLHQKPVGLLDVDGYFAGLRAFVERALDDAFIPAALRDVLLLDTDAAPLVERLRAAIRTR